MPGWTAAQPAGMLHARMSEPGGFRGATAIVGVADAGVSIDDVDGIAAAATGGGAHPSMELAQFLGISPSWTDSTTTGGSSFEVHVEHAAAAIALGLCDVAVSVYCSTPA